MKRVLVAGILVVILSSCANLDREKAPRDIQTQGALTAYKSASIDRSIDDDRKDFITPSGHPEKTFTNVPFVNLQAGLTALCESKALRSVKGSPFGKWEIAIDSDDMTEVQYVHAAAAASIDKVSGNGPIRSVVICSLLTDDGVVEEGTDFSMTSTDSHGSSHATDVHAARTTGMVPKSYSYIWFVINGTYPTFHVTAVPFEHNGYRGKLYPLREENLVENAVQLKLDELTNDQMVYFAKSAWRATRNTTSYTCVVHVGVMCTKAIPAGVPDAVTFEQFEEQHKY